MTKGYYFGTWPHDQTERLKQLWWDGKSAELCCTILGAVSARAVKEKVVREKFERNPVFKRIAKGDILAPLHRANGDFITIGTVKDRECRWMDAVEPTWDAPLCGRPTIGPSWCLGHRIRCYTAQGAKCLS